MKIVASMREWLLRLILVISGPVVFFGLLEGVLHLVSSGYPPEFFMPIADGHATNERFGWRFFPRSIARTPNPEVLADNEHERRVFVLGESAAMGFPDPAFGLPAYLQASLGKEWRVVNAAMTAINSHVVREIAFEAAKRKPKVFVIYMGNNEVIGPYGAASVFGNFSGNLAIIRAQMWARSLRTGQLFERLLTRPQTFQEWRGLEFFTNAQVTAEDPRLARVYHHYRDNLRQIIRAGQRAGAKIVVSTVAVNLKDCPPFASPDGRAQSAFDRGAYAEARDLDALRFRADSTINNIIREVAQAEHTVLFDAEREIEPAAENFWEHVHLRPKANRLLAQRIASLITSEVKPADIELTQWDENRLTRTIAAVVERPPFTAAHRARLAITPAAPAKEARDVWEKRAGENPNDLVAAERLAELNAELKNFADAEAIYRRLLTRLPLRSWHTGLGEALLNQGNVAGAKQAYEAALRMDNEFAPAFVGLGVVAAMQNNVSAAEDALRRAIALQPRLAEAHNNLGRILQAQNHLPEAIAEYRAAIDAKPDFAMARYSLGGLLVRSNQPAEAVQQLEAAIRIDPDFASAHYDLGLVLASLGRFDAAVEHYAEALRLNPKNADALNNWGTALARQHRGMEARKKFEAALALDPRHAAARRNLDTLDRP